MPKHLPTTMLSIYDTVSHAPLAIDRLLDVRSDKNSCRRPCSVDRTVGDAPANVCLSRPAAWTNTSKRREQKRILLYAVVYLKPKQLIIKDNPCTKFTMPSVTGSRDRWNPKCLQRGSRDQTTTLLGQFIFFG